MKENDLRLTRCFAAVFPQLSEDEIRAASADETAAWDSLGGVTLAAVVQEEFGIEIEPDVLPDLDSYRALREYLGRVNPAGEQEAP